jgi:heme/copper-type cytochrome/quinol oxidase subunit 2
MPIAVKVVSDAAYAVWLEQAKGGDYQLASN